VRTAPPKKEDEEAAQAAAAAAGLYGAAPLMMNDTLMIANSAAYSKFDSISLLTSVPLFLHLFTLLPQYFL
jgi:hypothetical protein